MVSFLAGFLAVDVAYILVGVCVALIAARRDEAGIKRFHADHHDLSSDVVRSIYVDVFAEYVCAWPFRLSARRSPQGPPRHEMLP